MKKTLLTLILLVLIQFVPRGAFGQAGNAIYFQNLTFDSHGDFIYLGQPDFGFTDKMTLTAWIKWTTDPGSFARSKATHDEREGYYATYIAYAQHGATNVTSEHGQFWLRNTKTGNNIEFTVENTSGTKVTTTSSTTPTSGTWYFLAGTYDGSNVRLYVNGSLESTVALTGNIRANTDCRMDMGRLPWGYGFFVGYLDEARIWDVALTEGQIQSQMASKTTILDENCKSYWNFDAGSGTTITDSKSLASGTFYSALIDVHTISPPATIVDSDRSFLTNAWNNKAAKTVAGAGVDETNTILFNTGNSFTFETAFNTLPVTDGNANMTWFGAIDASETSQWVSSSDLSLPVTLSDLSAENVSGGIKLEWSTESEIENLGFIIERKSVGANHDLPATWSQIASYSTDPALEGHGTTTVKHTYQYTDNIVQPGTTYIYRLGDVDYNGTLTWHKTVTITTKAGETQVAATFGLHKAYPNPFNPSVTISYGLSEPGQANVSVFNMRGQMVETLVKTYQLTGTYEINWQPVDLSAGLYIVSLQSGHQTNFHKLIYIK